VLPSHIAPDSHSNYGIMLEITGIKFLISLLAISAIVVAIIALLRQQMKRKGRDLLASGTAPQQSYSKQYAEVNVFAYASTLLRFGMVVSLVLVIFAFNWTTYEREIDIPTDVTILDDDLLIAPPRAPEPPPPLPPPPPEILEVPEEEVVEEQEDFIDQTVEVDEVVEVAPPSPIPLGKPDIVPPPVPEPPSPPPVIEVVDEEADKIFISVQQMPRFTECEHIDGTNDDKKSCAETKMLKFIYSKIKYPTIARENGIEGMVVIGFVVEKDGSITGAQILRDIGGGCGAEALRVVNQMPDWVPGYQRDKPVRVQFNLPVRFKLKW